MRNAITWLGLVLFAVACSEQPPAVEPAAYGAQAPDAAPAEPPAIESNPLRNAYFGDTHVHTVLSVDAYLMGTRRTPDDAYRFPGQDCVDQLFRIHRKPDPAQRPCEPGEMHEQTLGGQRGRVRCYRTGRRVRCH